MPRRILSVRLWQVLIAFGGISALFVVMGLVLGHAIENNRKAIRAGRATDARLKTVLIGVCELRLNLEQEIASSSKFLADIRAGRRKPIAGISNADIQVGINRQQKTLDALSVVECAKPKGAP